MRPGRSVARAAAAAMVAAAVCGAAALPAHAEPVAPDPTDAALGFGAPLRISARGQEVRDVKAVMAPTGRVLVTWLAQTSADDHYQYMAAVGDSAPRLGPAARVAPAESLLTDSDSPQMLALSDGTFALCLGVTVTTEQWLLRCTFAPPGQGFGPLVTIDRSTPDAAPGFEVAARPGGTLIFLLAHDLTAAKTTLTTVSADGSGTVGAVHPLATISSQNWFDIAATNDGTVAAAWSEGEYLSPHVPSLRIMPPGADDFGGPVNAGLPGKISESLELSGGNQLQLRYDVAGGGNNASRVIVRRPDGSFAPPAYLPVSKDLTYGKAFELPDGSLFAITSSSFARNVGCGNVTRSSIGVGPLAAAPLPPTVLSAKGQLPEPGGADAGALADGSIVAMWGDSFAHGDKEQLEVAIRPAGATAFKPAQVLPGASSYGGSLAVGSDQAILAWVVGGDGSPRSKVFVSTLRRSAPYAVQAKRPKHPSTLCN